MFRGNIIFIRTIWTLCVHGTFMLYLHVAQASTSSLSPSSPYYMSFHISLLLCCHTIIKLDSIFPLSTVYFSFHTLFDPHTPHKQHIWNHIFWCCYGGILTFLMGTVCDRNSRQQFNDRVAIVNSVCIVRICYIGECLMPDRWDRLRWNWVDVCSDVCYYCMRPEHKCDLSETIKITSMWWGEWKKIKHS